jgi:hypothetical protein
LFEQFVWSDDRFETCLSSFLSGVTIASRENYNVMTMVLCCCARDGFKISKEKETLRKIPMGVRSGRGGETFLSTNMLLRQRWIYNIN